MSVMNGFRAELFDKIVGLNGHAVVQGYDGRLSGWQQIVDQAKKTPAVTSAIPLIETPLMATANGRFEGVLVRGMRIEDIRGNRTIMSNVVAGDMRSVSPGSGKVAVALYVIAKEPCDHLLVGRAIEHLAIVAVTDTQHLWTISVVAAAFAPKVRRLERRHQHFERAGTVLLFANDPLDLLEDAEAERQPGINAGGRLADQAGA
jgi:hypothetical protein